MPPVGGGCTGDEAVGGVPTGDAVGVPASLSSVEPLSLSPTAPADCSLSAFFVEVGEVPPEAGPEPGPDLRGSVAVT